MKDNKALAVFIPQVEAYLEVLKKQPAGLTALIELALKAIKNTDDKQVQHDIFCVIDALNSIQLNSATQGLNLSEFLRSIDKRLNATELEKMDIEDKTV